MEQGAGVFQHHARLLAFTDEPGNKFAHPLVAPAEHPRVIAIAANHHMLEVADDFRCAQISPSGRNQRLMHVQCDSESALDAAKIGAHFRPTSSACLLTCGQYPFFLTADIRHITDVFR